MYKIDIDSVENEMQGVIAFYKKQIEAFRQIRKQIETVQWSDANYDRLIVSMNTIGKELCNIIQHLSNGNDVYVISEILPLAKEYLSNQTKFPRI